MERERERMKKNQTERKVNGEKEKLISYGQTYIKHTHIHTYIQCLIHTPMRGNPHTKFIQIVYKTCRRAGRASLEGGEKERA